MKSTAAASVIKSVTNGYDINPHGLLGTHMVNGVPVIRAWFPGARSVSVKIADGDLHAMIPAGPEGFFEAVFTDKSEFFPYLFEVTDTNGQVFHQQDAYRFLPTISEYDLHLFNEGNHHRIYERMGCHPLVVEGISGASFVVWAPYAQRVSVVGDFNQWDGRRHMMRRLGSSGVWEIFVPAVAVGDVYKFEIMTPSNEIYIKSDPYAYHAQLSPNTASVCHGLGHYDWADGAWMSAQQVANGFRAPVNIYEVHLGSWMREPDPDPESETGFRPLSYRQLAETLIPYVKEMGYTHLELMPVMEHPFDGSWGYQVTGYFAATSRYGTPEDFKYFIDTCHQNQIGIILDWVPAHFPKDGHGLARFDGTGLYEHEDPRQGEHEQWGTHIFNFGRLEVRNFLTANALFWFDQYHIDGLRVDAVASMLYLDYARPSGDWIPNPYGGRENVEAVSFIKHLNQVVFHYFPHIMMIAEESTSWPMVTKPIHDGGLGFSHKWNMGWMNDFLKYMEMDSLFRKNHQNLITFSFMYAWSENFVLVLSHDEVVHGKKSLLDKMPGDYWQKFAGLRAAYGYFFTHPGKKLLFMGSEFGQFIEWRYKEQLDWHLLGYDMHKKMQDCVKTLNHLYTTEPALYQVDTSHEGFEWIDCNDTNHSIISFIRKGKDWRDMLVILCNFTPLPQEHYRIGAPLDTTYTEIYNSDCYEFGGSGVTNPQPIVAEKSPFHQKPYSIHLRVPPLATVILKPDTEKYKKHG
jgi:1,4-alpha-glucan branching enzyme